MITVHGRVNGSTQVGRKEKGLHAVRAIVLYPLNALVEDQLRRLRSTLDSMVPMVPKMSINWLNTHEHGRNRILFGRYTGETPVPGEKTAQTR